MQNFKITKICKEILIVEELKYSEHCNIIVFIVKNEAYIFDCGLGIYNLRKFLTALGITRFTVLLTHSHFDHVGGIYDFKKDPVLAPPVVIKELKSKNFGLDFLKPDDFTDSNDYQLVLKNFKIFNPESCKSIIYSTSFGRYHFSPINLPGHTSDSFAYYDEKNGILVSGDIFYKGKLYYQVKDVKKYIHSLEILNQLDVKLVLPGHNEILGGKEFKRLLRQEIKNLRTVI